MIDVREKDERDEGYIPGSRNVPYRLMRLCCPDLPRDRPVVTICGSGPRAAIAASVLRAKGIDARPVVDGGMNDWLARGETAVSFRRCGLTTRPSSSRSRAVAPSPSSKLAGPVELARRRLRASAPSVARRGSDVAPRPRAAAPRSRGASPPPRRSARVDR